MTQVVILGFDGLDADLLRVYGPALPHLRRLMLESPFLELTSSIPPDTYPAWGSLYTGLNPANHGLLSLPTSDLELAGHGAGEPPALTCGTTFWDLASASGKRICVLNPYLAYPAWPVNGVMLALSPRDGSMSITPEEYELSLAFPALPRLAEQAARREQLRTFYHELVSCTLQQAALGLELLQQESWDLFFLQLNALDVVQHLFWHYSDLSDPAYPGQSEHLTRIQSFYRLCDHIVGEVRAALPAESILLVVSAYGHGRRSHQRVHLNEWLRRQGLLVVQSRSPRLLERPLPARSRSYPASDELLAHAGLAVREHQPPARSRSRLIDEERSLARAFSLGGDGPFGGVALNRQGLEEQGRDYEEVRTSLQEEIQGLRSRGRPLLRWVRKREEVYQGRYLERLPDLLFELQSDFAIGDDLYVPLLTTQAARRTVSGTHRKDGVLLIGNLLHHEPKVNDMHEITVMDVAPTVLSLLGINNAVRFDGQSLLALRTAESLS
ncbi:MAG: alkaline phosphatase family protein [Thermogemmatispora sp.]|uniref:alkaline phosphatase family protein n=1 Tax=Thermogemmatispora sp. TaxID=1968838 RepID=UPI0026138AC6|nr:alkaline phosphatase family protein [Thermogemmatispora sp.]MBX5457346.1 alkaline phosphatase family protein [Thermogemmatispora sp.]